MTITLLEQLTAPLVRRALLAALLVGVLAGAVGPFVVARRMAFGVHGLAELSFTGAAAGLLTGTGVVLGALGGTVLLAVLLAVLSVRERDRDVVTGVVFAAGLGLGVLMSTGYQGYTRQATAVLLVLSLLTVPAAAASRVTGAPAALLALSVTLAVTAAVGGVVLSVATDIRPSVCVVAVSTCSYLLCRAAAPALARRRPPRPRPGAPSAAASTYPTSSLTSATAAA